MIKLSVLGIVALSYNCSLRIIIISYLKLCNCLKYLEQCNCVVMISIRSEYLKPQNCVQIICVKISYLML